MVYESIDKEAWCALGDRISRTLDGREVELDVIGLDVGDQIEGTHLILDGVSYDSSGDALHVFLQTGTRDQHLDHIIHAPREIYLGVAEAGISLLAVMDGEGHKQFLRFRDLLQLPSA